MTVTASDQTSITHGDHVDTIESVDMVFRAQRKLSFTYGAIFFAVTLLIPALSVWWEGWYATKIWGGFTLNYLFVSLLYYLFLWTMAWTYSKQADKLDDTLADMADEITSKGGEGS
ncbi:MAG: hypothetical protein CVT60_04070 [Actinobacteria bacterium HGW-Actinobacteria-10]|jgi:uncharacterized membrane protein (DUF485 family)|nr:MAG: hypothetical protein CVT60_04070 [Actinobacteria bacterium HGW-Actinobacteria-10]